MPSDRTLMRLFVASDIAVFTRHFADEITPLPIRGQNDVAHLDPLRDGPKETTNQQSCGGKKRAMLAYGLVQISATVVSAVSLAAIAVGLCAVKQESRLFNGCVETVVAEGRSQAEAVRYCNGG